MTILCAIDEQTAPEVAGVAGELAAAIGSRVVLARVLSDPPLVSSQTDRTRERNRAKGRGRATLDQVRSELPEGLDASFRVELGSAVEKLLEIAGDEDAELIVVGSRGRGALRSAVLGSVSRSLAQQAPCPVVVVTPGAVKYHATRPHRPDGPRPSLVCGVDGSESSLSAARLASDLAARLGDRLLLVHAYDAQGELPVPAPVDAGDAEAKILRAALDHVHGDAEGMIAPGPPAHALESIANRAGARLIVVGARGMGRLGSALFGSVSAQLAAVAGCPVVVLPERAQLESGSHHYALRKAPDAGPSVHQAPGDATDAPLEAAAPRELAAENAASRPAAG
jgi:nucleotide-binding universal stress UspA family protein